MVLATVWLLRQPSEVSERHDVTSHADNDKRAPIDIPVTPYWPPITVMLSEPVPPAFNAIATLNVGAAAVNPPDIVPAPPPTVTTTFTLPPPPDPAALHTIELSDTHIVLKQPLSPMRSAPSPESQKRPSPLPYTVMLNDPLAAALVPYTPLTETGENDKLSLTLPVDEEPALRSIPRLLTRDDAARHAVQVSDTHLLLSQPLRPALTPPVYDARPIAPP